MPRSRRALPLLLALLASACGAGDGGATGALRIGVRAESQTLDEPFVDGFEVTFDHVLVCLVEFGLEGAEGESAALSVDGVIMDLRNGDAALWEERAPVGSWTGVWFETRAARHSDRILGEVGDNEIHYMLQHGYGMAISGSARKGSETFTFFLGFPAMRYDGCSPGPSPLDIAEGSDSTLQIGFHLDHLFYDRLAEEDGSLRFEAFAASAFSNDLTNPFLGRRLEDIVDREGNPIMNGDEPVVYDPSPLTIMPSTLEQYFLAAGRTMGHVTGGGRCEGSRLE